MFLHNQILHTFHDELRTLIQKFREHADRLRTAAGILIARDSLGESSANVDRTMYAIPKRKTGELTSSVSRISQPRYRIQQLPKRSQTG